jgi:hypothetical protein
MKFPAGYCVPTKYLTKEKYDWLLCKLVSEGYTYPSKLYLGQSFDMWRFIGVGSHGTIHLFDRNAHYIDLDDEPFYNVLSETFIEEYLK